MKGVRSVLGFLGFGFSCSLAGCLTQDLRTEFANEFSCDSSDVDVEELGLRRYRVTGCGRTVRYSCPNDADCIPTNESAPEPTRSVAEKPSHGPNDAEAKSVGVARHEKTKTGAAIAAELRLDEQTLLKLRAQPGTKPGATLQIVQLEETAPEVDCELSALSNGQRLALPKAKVERKENKSVARTLRTIQVELSAGLIRELGGSHQFALKACDDRWTLSPEALTELHRFASLYEEDRAWQEAPREGGTGGLLAPVDGWPEWKVSDAAPTAGSGATLEGPALFKLLSPSVFKVEVSTAEGTAQGSAVAISRTELLTNCHVLEDARTLTLKQGKTERKVRIARADPAADRCVLVVAEPNLTPVRGVRAFADLRVGEPTFTVGSPSGLELSLSNGIVSGKREEGARQYIQTTAPISPGSSGGGLFDGKGDLLGITTSVLVGRENHNQALNFAIPAELFWKQ
ncbi:MAG: trypsin-like peptidase domain-containing protein [Polyangiaceae bacterium]